MHQAPHPKALDRFASFLIERRGVVLGALAILTVGLATQIPRLQVDPAPENLIRQSDGAAERLEGRFAEAFGDSSRVLVVVVQGEDVLATPALQYQHDIARHFARHRWVARVDGLTVSNLPRLVAAPEEVVNLDDIEAEIASTEDEFDPDVYNALLALAESDPERFPGGIDELGPRLAERLKTDPVVTTSRVPPEASREILEALRYEPLLVGRLVSADHKVAAVALHIRDIPPRRMPEMVRALESYIGSHAPPRGLTVRVAGLPYLRSTIVSEMRHDQLVLVPLTVLIVGLLMYLSMRWLPGVILPLVAVAFCAVQVVGGMAISGIAMNVLNNIIPPLLIIVGISDAIHLVERYREEMVRTQGDKKKAIHKAVVSMTIAGLITSLTTSVGLASLGISQTVMLRQFGITAGVGVFYAFVMTMWMLPAVLTFAKAPPQSKEREGNHFVERLIINTTARILRRPWLVLAIAAVVISACAYASQSIKRDHALLDQFRSDDPVYLTTRMLEQQLDGVRPLEVMFTSDVPNRFDDPEVIEAIDSVARWADRRPEVIRTLTHGDMLRQSLALVADDPAIMQQRFSNRAETRALFDLLTRNENPLENWVTQDRKSARMQLKLRDVGAHATLELVDDIRAELGRKLRRFPDVRVQLTGEAYNSSIGQRTVVEDLGGSMLSAVIVIFFLLAILFRSVRLGLLSIPPNLVPLLGTMAYMVVRGIPLNATTVIIFSVSLGLSDHGTIHFMSRFQQETEAGMWTRAAIIRAARGTGFATVEANLSLMAGFGVMLLSSFKPVQQFGELIAVTILLCLMASLFLQPALLMVFGASRPLKERMRRESAKIAALRKATVSELGLGGEAS